MTVRRQGGPALRAGLIPAVMVAAALPGLPAALACGPQAELHFTEAWPDTFEILNRSPPGWQIEVVRIDLEGSVGNLFFEPSDAGPGAGLSDPPGPARLVGVSAVRDGDTSVTLLFERFAAGTGFIVTIDVDGRDGEVVHSVVAPGAIAGAGVDVRFAAGADRVEARGRFDAGDTALTVDESACG